jgi:hypothetical protein
MGKDSSSVQADCDSEANNPGSCEAHNVTSSPQEDCGVPACEMGEVEGRKEGCLAGGLAKWKCTMFH